jgi:ParB-like chromosome segregation protein Spo0J
MSRKRHFEATQDHSSSNSLRAAHLNSSYKISQLKIDKIIINENRHQASEERINELIASIMDVGLLQPIVVSASGRLVAGQHRLVACQRLGWTTIQATIVPHDDLKNEREEIDENLVRYCLTVLQRGELHKRAKELHEALSGEGVGQDDERNNFAAARPYTELASCRSNLSRRSIEQEIRISTLLNQEVRDLLRETSVADRKNDLLALTKYSPEEQRELALIISAGAQTLDAALRIYAERLEPEDKLKLVESKHARRLRRLLEVASSGDAIEEYPDQDEVGALIKKYSAKGMQINRTFESILQCLNIKKRVRGVDDQTVDESSNKLSQLLTSNILEITKAELPPEDVLDLKCIDNTAAQNSINTSDVNILPLFYDQR